MIQTRRFHVRASFKNDPGTYYSIVAEQTNAGGRNRIFRYRTQLHAPPSSLSYQELPRAIAMLYGEHGDRLVGFQVLEDLEYRTYQPPATAEETLRAAKRFREERT